MKRSYQETECKQNSAMLVTDGYDPTGTGFSRLGRVPFADTHCASGQLSEGVDRMLNPKKTLQERIERMRKVQEAAKAEAERLRREREKAPKTP